MATLRPFFGYYGGKWRRACTDYPAPRFGTIVEPFAGSAGYALRYPDRRVILNELDPKIAGVWSYLLRVTPAEVLALPDVPLDGSMDDVTGIPQEARWLIGLWLNKGNQRVCKTPSAWMRSGKYPGSFWGDRVRGTIAGQLEAIRHWTIRHGDYRGLDVPGEATWFVDPPYQEMGRHYTHGSRGIDFRELAGWCRGRAGQVIACEAAGADWLPFREVSVIRTTRKGRPAREAVWLSDERWTQISLLDEIQRVQEFPAACRH